MYLGVDQSLRSTGVALVSSEGSRLYTGTVTPLKLTGAPRLAYIRDNLRNVVVSSGPITHAALEGYAMDAVNRSFDLGEVGGLVRLLLHDLGIPFVVVAPTSLKQFAGCSGVTSKKGMREAVLKTWKLDIEQNDECDAFVLAQVARAVHSKKGSTRAQLEVVKKLSEGPKKIKMSFARYSGPSL